MRYLIKFIQITTVLLTFFGSVALATTVDVVRVTVQFGDSTPVENVDIEIIDYNGIPYDYQYTDSFGEAQFWYPVVGQTTFKIAVRSNTNILHNAKYKDVVQVENVQPSNAYYDSFLAAYVQDVVITLQEEDNVIFVKAYKAKQGQPTVPDLNEPLVDMDVSGWAQFDPNFYIVTKTDTEGVAEIGIPDGYEGEYYFDIYSSEISPQGKPWTFTGSNDGDEIIFAVYQGSSQIEFQLFEEGSNTPYVVPTGYGSASVYCYPQDPNNLITFDTFIEEGQSSATLLGDGNLGMYQCNGWLPPEANASIKDTTLDLTGDAPSTVRLDILEVSGTVTITLTDQNGNPIMKPDADRNQVRQEFDVNLWTDPLREQEESGGNEGSDIYHYGFGTTVNGKVDIPVIEGLTYYVDAWPTYDENASSAANPYNTAGFKPIKVTGSTLQVEQKVTVIDTFATVILYDENGERVQSGHAHAYGPDPNFNYNEEEEAGEANPDSIPDDYFSYGQIIDGTARIPIVPGRDLYIGAYGDAEKFYDGSVIPPPEQIIRFEEGNEEPTVELRASKPNFTLEVSLSLDGIDLTEEELLNAEFTYCHADTGNNAFGFSDQLADGKHNISLFIDKKRPQLASVYCGAHILSDNPEEPGSEYFWYGVVKPKANKDKASITISPEGDPTAVYPEATENFQLDQDKTFRFPTGAEMTVREGTFGNSGQAFMTYQTPTGVSKGTVKVREAWDINFNSGQQQANSEQPNKPVRLCFKLSEEEQANPEGLQIAHYNTQRKNWDAVESTISGNQICANATEFSKWAKVFNALKEAIKNNYEAKISKPRRNKKGKGNRFTISFTKNEDAAANAPFTFFYSPVKNKKKCLEIKQDDFKKRYDFNANDNSKNNKEKFVIKSRGSTLCGALVATGGNADNTTNSFRKGRSRKK